jgi:hypothetical protein
MTQNPLHDIATWLDRAGPSGHPLHLLRASHGA